MCGVAQAAANVAASASSSGRLIDIPDSFFMVRFPLDSVLRYRARIKFLDAESGVRRCLCFAIYGAFRAVSVRWRS
ncbi:hypothetical protein D3C83_159290 [compost metagenome]